MIKRFQGWGKQKYFGWIIIFMLFTSLVDAHEIYEKRENYQN